MNKVKNIQVNQNGGLGLRASGNEVSWDGNLKIKKDLKRGR
jgi:hypothetical protein